MHSKNETGNLEYNEKQQIPHCWTIPKYNRKIAEKDKIDTLNV